MAEEKNLLRQVKIQPENRTETVKKVFDLFEKKLSAENFWQIKVASVVSSIFIETRNFTQETNYQLNKDELKSYLGQLKGLYETKPSDFPLDLENTVKPLIELNDKNLSDTTIIIQILQHSKKLLAQAMNQ